VVSAVPDLIADPAEAAARDLDRIAGVFSRPQHALAGQNYVGKILVLNAAKGGVATAWMLREMAARGKAPLALLLNFANPIMAQGAAFGGIPLMGRCEGDVTALLRSGGRLRVTPARGEVIITRG